MESPVNFDKTTRYVQGSVWHWSGNGDKEDKAGVQGGERPVLIISNNTFNQFSPSVNCVSITSILKQSPVHVPVFITKNSHIQCEQIHTVSKSDLIRFMGMVSENTLSNVKAKIKEQFDIGMEQNTKLLMSLKKSIDNLHIQSSEPETLTKILSGISILNEKAEKGFGIPEIEDTFISLMQDLYNSFKKVSSDVEVLKAEARQESDVVNIPLRDKPAGGAGTLSVPDKITGDTESVSIPDKSTYDTESLSVPNKTASDTKSLNILDKPIEDDALSKADSAGEAEVTVSGDTGAAKPKKNSYTGDDYIFIADSETPNEAIMKKYGLDIKGVYRMRSFSKKWLAKNNTGRPGKPKEEKQTTSGYRKYTEEDIAFVLDAKNTIADLVERFGFREKQSAYKAKAYIQKRYAGATG